MDLSEWSGGVRQRTIMDFLGASALTSQRIWYNRHFLAKQFSQATM
jgi:hypothetical protein